jgi:TPP-dependent pyruvate/acetoin dehydrogenase alpha subunit
MRGHAAHDNQSYVAKELLEDWRRRDPIASYETALVDSGGVTREEIGAVAAKVDAFLDEELAWADAQPLPRPEEALGGVFAGDEPGSGRS